MTREQAINHIKNSTLYKYDRETADMAITALEAEPCSDAISRQAVLDAIGRVGMCKCSTNEIEAVSECTRAVKALPPVTAEPKTGHWIKRPHGFKCSNCLIVHSHTSIFCPSCGAKMVEESEEQE